MNKNQNVAKFQQHLLPLGMDKGNGFVDLKELWLKPFNK